MVLCTQTRNAPSASRVRQDRRPREGHVVFPADGNVHGRLEEGREVAQRGTGGQFTDTPDTYRGGNCYACHELAAKEVSYGTLGPSLKGYGKARKFSRMRPRRPMPRSTIRRACWPVRRCRGSGTTSSCPKQQIKDVVAYLFDPESPVNK
jgi:sulfur-oxidizing protein SoxX